MGLQSLITRGLPDPAEVEHHSAVDQILASPLLLPVRLFWNTLQDFRPWWPVLLPWLLLLAVRTYRRERQEYKAERAALAVRQAMNETTTRRT